MSRSLIFDDEGDLLSSASLCGLIQVHVGTGIGQSRVTETTPIVVWPRRGSVGERNILFRDQMWCDTRL